MYSREQSYREGIPDNYNGTAMGARNEKRDCEYPKEECRRPPKKEDCFVCDNRPPQKDECPPQKERDGCARDECYPPPPYDECRECPPQKRQDERGGGILSSLLCRLGFDGVDNTDFIILFVALLLMSGDKKDEDSYIWLLLLFLLIK